MSGTRADDVAPHGDVGAGVAVFEEYLAHLAPHNPQWLACPPPWCADLRLSNEEVVGGAERAFGEAAARGEGAMALPVRIAASDVLGRHLVATRNITPGEVVIVEPPLLLALRAKSPPYCSTCFRRARDYTCPRCGFFLCGEGCLTKRHKEECCFLQRLGLAGPTAEEQQREERELCERLAAMAPEERAQAEALLQRAKVTATHQRHYEVLRHYVVGPRHPDPGGDEQERADAGLVLSLQGHRDEASQRFRVNQRRIVDVVVGTLQASTDAALVHRICSVWDTNGFEVPLGWGTRVHGLYPFASLLTHDCRANTQQWFTAGGTLVLRAVDHIAAGQVVTTSYTDPQWATMLRQDHLRVSKQFTCTCQRCADPTEMGTFMGSPKCSGCGGPVVSSAPLDPGAVWVCHAGCPHTASAKQVAGVGASVGAKLRGLDSADGAAIGTAADHLKDHLHPTHHVLLQLHVSTLRTMADKDLRELSDDALATLGAIAKLVVGVVIKLEAPLTRLSVRMFREDIRVRLEVLRRQKLRGHCIEAELKDLTPMLADCEIALGWDARMPAFDPVLHEYQTLLNP
ncbi:LOW QUALITY PROTEIN: SET domain-containing protein SmydA-8-like [Penaeus chinensis]|uniref:LOW QUALITY PROTEIN: SET domain-containing protein SmydA-8-like n=1 Tax=Penaeus chinensis TaxID=139456 RepID=UPI001FB637E6|nr:LOW QUALITY PROTEIN: SET domain-containing protein SmydA-8-like [Penaeus chinensis]